jgi:chromosome segregation ATPase
MSPSEYQDLVAFLGERFEVIDQRFQVIDQRFEAMDRRFEVIDQRFEAMDRRFESLHGEFVEFRGDLLRHFDELYRRLERLEGEYQAITQALRRIEALLADERGRRQILERELATLRENVAVLKARLDDVERRLQEG